MLYLTNEARESARNEIARLYVMLAETKPTDQWFLQDIQSLMRYLQVMQGELAGEMKEETDRKKEYEETVPVYGVNRYYDCNKKIIEYTSWFYHRDEAEFATTQGQSGKTIITARYHDEETPYITMPYGGKIK